MRAVSSVANCVAVSPVVRWCGNGLFRWVFESICDDLSSILAFGGTVV